MPESDQEPGSLSRLMQGASAGDKKALSELLLRVQNQVRQMARKRLTGAGVTFVDEDDVANSVLFRLSKGIQGEKFDLFDKRRDLWLILATIVANRVRDLKRSTARQKRGGGAALSQLSESQAEDTGPQPDEIAITEEELERLFEILDNDRLRTVARLRMDDCTNKEIAATLGVSQATVGRSLGLIRSIWSDHVESICQKDMP